MREALWSSTGIVFNGAETNCRIAHVLDILLMVSYWFAFYFSDIIVVCTVSIHYVCLKGSKFYSTIEQYVVISFHTKYLNKINFIINFAEGNDTVDLQMSLT